jgi:hypothetical protein
MMNCDPPGEVLGLLLCVDDEASRRGNGMLMYGKWKLGSFANLSLLEMMRCSNGVKGILEICAIFVAVEVSVAGQDVMRLLRRVS